MGRGGREEELEIRVADGDLESTTAVAGGRIHFELILRFRLDRDSITKNIIRGV
jgi:hypothetical protein